MPRGNNFKGYQKQKREDMYSAIDEAIAFMRENKITITKKNLAEELGVSERALYSEYVKIHLLRFIEFNPNLSSAVDNSASEEMKQELAALKLKLKEVNMKSKELASDLKAQKEKYEVLAQKYQRVLGVYQDSFGSKITPL